MFALSFKALFLEQKINKRIDIFVLAISIFLGFNVYILIEPFFSGNFADFSISLLYTAFAVIVVFMTTQKSKENVFFYFLQLEHTDNQKILIQKLKELQKLERRRSLAKLHEYLSAHQMEVILKIVEKRLEDKEAIAKENIEIAQLKNDIENVELKTYVQERDFSKYTAQELLEEIVKTKDAQTVLFTAVDEEGNEREIQGIVQSGKIVIRS